MKEVPFEILTTEAFTHDTSNERAEATSYRSVVKCIPFMAASLSVVMSLVTLDNYSKENQYNPIFANVESYQNALTSALGDDYEIQSNLLQRLNILKSSLKSDWNGELDYPIEEKAYNNARTAILTTPSAMLKYWRLFPNPNGTLLLSPKNKSIAGISIGNEEFSYAAFVSEDKQISGKEPFNDKAFRAALVQIHRILEYV